MNRIEDEPIKFYLEHRARITEWAGLEAEVRKFADRFYGSLKDDLDAALRTGQIADDDVESFFHEYPDYRGLGLRRRDWPRGAEDPDVRLQWHRKWVSFSDGDHLICGVRTKLEHYRQLLHSGEVPQSSKTERRLVAGLCRRRSSGWQVLGR